MVLLKHDDFEFKNILSGGYNIIEDEPDVLSESTMADGSIRRNYGKMPKTNIKIKFNTFRHLFIKTILNFFKNISRIIPTIKNFKFFCRHI